VCDSPPERRTFPVVIERLADGVGSGALAVLVNLALLGELAGLYSSRKDENHSRFRQTVRFIFEAGQGSLMLPLDQGLLLRFGG